MRVKFLVMVLVLFLAAPISTQNEVIKEGVIHKQLESDTLPISALVAKGDKTGVILASAWVQAVQQVTNPAEYNWIKYLDADKLYFFVNFTALFSTRVRFHLIISGPEFYSYTSPNWIQAKYKTSSYWFKWGNKSEFFSKKGEYKVIFIAEQEKPYGGENCVATCTIRVF